MQTYCNQEVTRLFRKSELDLSKFNDPSKYGLTIYEPLDDGTKYVIFKGTINLYRLLLLKIA